MPTLKITRRGLAPDYLRATFEYLLGVMLWPADEDRRDEYLHTCAAMRHADLAAAVPGAFTAAEMVSSLQEAALARAPADWREEMISRLHRGLLVGLYFARCWNRAVTGERVVIKELHALMTSTEFRAQHPSVDLGPKALEAAIRQFRPAGPLWGAVVILREERGEMFTPEAVADLLGTAEHVRRLAAATPLQGRSGALLPADVDVWRPPAWLQIPELRLVPSRADHSLFPK